MILSQLQTHINGQGPLTLRQLSHHFDVPEEALQGMLGLLVKKGKVLQLKEQPSCGGCTSCDDHLIPSFVGKGP